MQFSSFSMNFFILLNFLWTFGQVTTPGLMMSYSWKMIRLSAKSEFIQFL